MSEIAAFKPPAPEIGDLVDVVYKRDYTFRQRIGTALGVAGTSLAALAALSGGAASAQNDGDGSKNDVTPAVSDYNPNMYAEDFTDAVDSMLPDDGALEVADSVESSTGDSIACPNGGDPVEWTWRDTNENGIMNYGEVGCMDEEGNWVWYIPPETDPYGTDFVINREPSSFHPVTPSRLVDTRWPDSQYEKLDAGKYMDVTVVGGEIPADASSVTLNLTVAGATDAGYFTVYPTGTPRPDTSNLNPQFAGQDEANIATVPVGEDGKIRIFSSHGGDVIVDPIGYFKPADNPEGTATSGRFEAIETTRVYDPRPNNQPLIDGVVREFNVSDTCDPNEFDAAFVNFTAADSTGDGFLTVSAGDQPIPNTSTLNFTRGVATANGAIVGIGSEGTIQMQATVSQSDAKSVGTVNIIADVSGCVTNESAPESADGMFSSIQPTRLMDTRSGTKVHPGETRSVQIENTAGLDFEVSAVFANVTATQAETPNSGFITVDGEGEGTDTSVINVLNGETIATGAIIPVSEFGINGSVYITPTNVTAHMLFDVVGAFRKVKDESH